MRCTWTSHRSRTSGAIGFIEGALPGVPLAAGAEALEHGAAGAFEELGLEYVPRNWLQVVASLGRAASPEHGATPA
jgi:hypothetical protein